MPVNLPVFTAVTLLLAVLSGGVLLGLELGGRARGRIRPATRALFLISSVAGGFVASAIAGWWR